MRAAMALVVTAGLLAGAFGAHAQDAESKTATPAADAVQSLAGRSAVGYVQKVFVVKYADGEALLKLLRVFPAAMTVGNVSGQTVISASGPPQVLAVIEETIKRLDTPPVPQPSAEIVAQILECSTASDAPDVTPPAIKDVVAQLRKTFGYSGCGIEQTLFARAATGRQFSANSPGPRNTQGGIEGYSMSGLVWPGTGDGDQTIRFERFDLQASGFRQFKGGVTVNAGQQTVLGTLGSGDAGKVGVLLLTARWVK